MRVRAIASIAVISGTLAVGCTSPGKSAQVPSTMSPTHLVSHVSHQPYRKYLGVYERGVPKTYSGVETFARTMQRRPNIVLYYSDWNEQFKTAFARTAYQHGATVSVDINPYGVSIAKIADGRYDAYLRAYAKAVRRFGHKVIISFGHEPNGKWYPWGYTHVNAATWVRAWRHIVKVFRKAGASKVTWFWIVNQVVPGEGPIRRWWPGRAYVTWAGIDGYYFRRNETFDNVFAPTITAIRRLTKRPIMIAETAVGQVAGQAAKIPGLFAGVRSHHLIGLLWYDANQHHGIYHQRWRLEGNHRAVLAFRRALRG